MPPRSTKRQTRRRLPLSRIVEREEGKEEERGRGRRREREREREKLGERKRRVVGSLRI